MCEQYHVLPRSGGVLDQDYRHMLLIEAVARARQIKYDKDHPAT